MICSFRRITLLFVGVGLMFPSMLVARPSLEDQREKVRDMRDDVLAELYEIRPEAEARIEKAKGYAVFSNVGINVIFASFAGGKGVVVKNGGEETFMKMGSAGLGIGLGVKDFRAVFVFYSQRKMNDFIAVSYTHLTLPTKRIV